MRICILTELFPPHIGGQETRYLELGRRLAIRGHDVHVFCVKHNPSLPTLERYNSLFIHRAPLIQNYVQPFSRFQRKLGGVLAYALSALIRMMADRNFDVYLFNEFPFLHAAIAIPLLHTKPCVVDWCEVMHDRQIAMLQWFISRVATAHTTVSDVQKRKLQFDYHVSKEKICSITNGVTLERYRADRHLKTPSSILYIGRLVPHKQLNLLIEGAAMAHNLLPSLTLNIVGHGDMLHHLRRATRSLDFIRIWGPVSEETKIRLLESASIFALTSAREGFSIAVTEAVASGTPVLTVDEPMNVAKELVQSWGTGIVVKPTPQAVAQGLIQLCRDAEYWDGVHQNCLRIRSSLSWDSSADKLERFLFKVSAYESGYK